MYAISASLMIENYLDFTFIIWAKIIKMLNKYVKAGKKLLNITLIKHGTFILTKSK